MSSRVMRWPCDAKCQTQVICVKSGAQSKPTSAVAGPLWTLVCLPFPTSLRLPKSLPENSVRTIHALASPTLPLPTLCSERSLFFFFSLFPLLPHILLFPFPHTHTTSPLLIGLCPLSNHCNLNSLVVHSNPDASACRLLHQSQRITLHVFLLAQTSLAKNREKCHAQPAVNPFSKQRVSTARTIHPSFFQTKTTYLATVWRTLLFMYQHDQLTSPSPLFKLQLFRIPRKPCSPNISSDG